MAQHKKLPMRRKRAAFLLVLVTVFVIMAGLAAFNFSDSMVTQHEAAQISGSRLQARYMTESGLQSVRLLLAYDRLTLAGMGGTWDNPQKFQAINIVRDSDPAKRGNVTFVAPALDQTGLYAGFRFGLQNESAKLNLNALAQIDSLSSSAAGAMSALGVSGGAALGTLATSGGSGSGTGGGIGINSMLSGASTGVAGATVSAAAEEAPPTLGAQMLLALPGMTEDVADAVLDFIDEDDEPRPYGAEYDFYQQLVPPYRPINGPLVSIEQLLLVRGITPQLLFGYDANRNGFLDGNELSQAQLGIQPGSVPGSQPPAVTADGQPVQPDPLGWAHYMTLFSQEKNVASDGTERININSDDLATLYSDLTAAGIDETWASFIIQYRISGRPPAGSGNAIQLLMTAIQQAAEEENQLSTLQSQQPAANPNPTTRNQAWSSDLLPSDLTQVQGSVKFNQVLDLFGATAAAQQAGGATGGQSGGQSGGQTGGQPTGQQPGGQQAGPAYDSPLSADPISMATAFPILMDRLTTLDSPTIPGRINIMECPRQILLGVPSMTEELADQIIQARNDGQQTENRRFETWLAVEGLVTMEQMRAFEPLITCGGDVYKAQVIGYFEGSAVSSRVEAIVSGAITPPRILFYRQLDHLNHGFDKMSLGLRPDAGVLGAAISR